MTNEHSPLAFAKRFRRDDGSAPTIYQAFLAENISTVPSDFIFEEESIIPQIHDEPFDGEERTEQLISSLPRFGDVIKYVCLAAPSEDHAF
ncbi:hypothetical protein PQX77_014953 [Marasmius sp. AFHP31]|nr:hypothetical protein PQX77_014953 [Marasmius sp. AFHP31]